MKNLLTYNDTNVILQIEQRPGKPVENDSDNDVSREFPGELLYQ